VTSYGYLRFREFKLGIASSHMAIGAFAREILLKAKSICESRGFNLIHGIVDSLYIHKEGITEQEVKDICMDIELETGIPISFEGIFKWIVFLPSVNDSSRPVPTRYYGLFRSGEFKVRGIEMRQAGSPNIVKYFQHMVLEVMAGCSTKEDIIKAFPEFCRLLRMTLKVLPDVAGGELSSFVRLSKTDYNNKVPQRQSIEQLKAKGISVLAGQKVSFIYTSKGTVLPEDYKGDADIGRYRQLLIRSLYVLVQPFGFTKKDIMHLVKDMRQTTLTEYRPSGANDQAGEMEAELQAI
jgi:DNA polymerase II